MAELDFTAGLRGRGAGRVPGPTCTSGTQKVADRDPPLEPSNSIAAHRASWISISSSTRVDQCIAALVQHYLQQGWMMYTHRKEDNHTAATEELIPSLQASAIKAYALCRSSATAAVSFSLQGRQRCLQSSCLSSPPRTIRWNTGSLLALFPHFAEAEGEEVRLLIRALWVHSAGCQQDRLWLSRLWGL